MDQGGRDDPPDVVDVEAEHLGEQPDFGPGDPAHSEDFFPPGSLPDDAAGGTQWKVVWGRGGRPQPNRGWLIPTLILMLLVGHGYRMAWDGARWFHLFDPKQALLGFLYGGIIFGICHLAWVLVGLLPRGASGAGGFMVFITIAWLGTQSCAACVFGAPAGEQGPMGGLMSRLGVNDSSEPVETWRVVSVSEECRLAPVGSTDDSWTETVRLSYGRCSQAFDVGDEVHLLWVGSRRSLIRLPDHTPVGQVYEIK